MPHPPIKLTISKVVFGGDGLAELNGKAVFVEGALTGEIVEVEITENKKDFARARVIRVLEPSPHRVQPPCRYATHCGGCQYQHVSYAEELRLKEAQLKEIFAHAGLAALIRPVSASQKEFGYRSSLTLHPLLRSAARSFGGRAVSARLGFYAKDNHTVIPVKNCLLADPAFLPIFSQELLAKKCPERVTFKLDEAGRIVSDLQETFLRMRLGERSYLVPSGGFFQTNPAVASRILERIVDEVAAFKPDVLFDLFCGVGTFGLAVAPACGTVVFIEESPRALEALDMNLAESHFSSAHVFRGRVEKLFPRAYREYGKGKAMLVVDPPRAGLDVGLARSLAAISTGKLLYLSCDPVTLERDIRLLRVGNWVVESLEPFDMFPKTKHLESLAILRRA